MKPERHKPPRPPLDSEGLQRLALFYVGRYATTGAKLRSYLTRKVRERGWEGERPDLDAMIKRFKDLGYIDDGAFASSRAASLQRRGYGERRVAQALQAAGIGEEDAADANAQAREGALAAALRFAERRRIGPFAAVELDREARQKAFAAMMRAGHPMEVVRRVLEASPGEIPDSDNI
ncbi:MAG TPA: regulatory protein RecX [Allosphingosinicella sp.]